MKVRFFLRWGKKTNKKIYKKMNGVKSVYALKPLQPASEKDLFDQFWYGDPYSFNAQENRGEAALRAMILKIKASPGDAHGDGLEFAEIALVENGISRFVRLSPSAEPPYFRTIESISKPVSRFALTWEDVSTPKDRAHWVAGSRLRVVDQESGAIVAERIGFLIEPALGSRAGQRRPWLSAKSKSNTCPEAHDWTDRWFVLSVLNSTEEMRHEK